MFLNKKYDIETAIIEKYLNKEINLLEKEMGLNVLYECCYAVDIDEDDKRVFKVISEQPVDIIADWIIRFGREEYNSHKVGKDEMEFLVHQTIKKREYYKYV
jgi:hypothetical protein